jgi:hypothetical protein
LSRRAKNAESEIARNKILPQFAEALAAFSLDSFISERFARWRVNSIALFSILRKRRSAGTISFASGFPRYGRRINMLKTTLYSVVAGGLLAAATITMPVAAAPAVTVAPQVEKNVNDVQYYHRRHWRHRHYHPHYDYYGYYGPRYHYYTPGPGIYLRAW